MTYAHSFPARSLPTVQLGSGARVRELVADDPVLASLAESLSAGVEVMTRLRTGRINSNPPDQGGGDRVVPDHTDRRAGGAGGEAIDVV